MPMPDHIAKLVATLDPAAQAVVELLWHFHEEQMGELRLLREQSARLQGQNEKFRKMLFGRSSEKLPTIQSEVRRQVEEEEFDLNLPPDAGAQHVAEALTKERRKRGRAASEPKRKLRKKALDRLPVVHKRISVSADELPEGMKRSDFRALGSGEVVRRIEHVREHLVVVEFELEKLVERGGERIVTAAPPPNIVDGGAWGTSVYAHIVVSKCVDSMPLYRQEKAGARSGYGIARSVMCELFHRAADLLRPLYDRLLELIRASPYVQADETRIRVAEANNARNGWIWTLLCDNIAAFVYSESRGAETPNQHLGGTAGYLVVDGYSGYNDVTGDGGRTRVGCWAHARRKFYEALATAPKAREVLDMIVALYRVEHDAADNDILGTPAHLILRQERSAPVLEGIDAWVNKHTDTVPPKSPLGTALTYARNQRPTLARFLEDPKLPLDNNASERQLRIIALGRKNFLFVGHAAAGDRLAILQTLCATCCLNGVNPYDYLSDVLVRIQTHKASRIDELLPMSWRPPPDVVDNPVC